MRKVVKFIISSYLVFRVFGIQDVSAITDQEKLDQLREDPAVQEYIDLTIKNAENAGNKSWGKQKRRNAERKRNRNRRSQEDLNSDYADDEQSNTRRNMNRTSVDENYNNVQNSNGSQNKKRRRTRRNNRNNNGEIENFANSAQNGQMARSNDVISNQNFNNQPNQNSRRRKNRNQNLNQPNQNRVVSSQKQDEAWKDVQALNLKHEKKSEMVIEPVINLGNLAESSVKIEKDTKIAAANQNPISDNLAQNETKLLAGIDPQATKRTDSIQDKISKTTANRKSYKLIHSPKMSLKQDTEIGKFRDELNRYRQMYSESKKTAQSA